MELYFKVKAELEDKLSKMQKDHTDLESVKVQLEQQKVPVTLLNLILHHFISDRSGSHGGVCSRYYFILIFVSSSDWFGVRVVRGEEGTSRFGGEQVSPGNRNTKQRFQRAT